MDWNQKKRRLTKKFIQLVRDCQACSEIYGGMYFF
jgi:hypothetical protein